MERIVPISSKILDTPVVEADLLMQLQPDLFRPAPGAGLAGWVGNKLPHSLRPRIRVWLTRLIRPQQRFLSRRLALRSVLKLNLGCGTLPLKDWVNVDLAGLPVDLVWDLRCPLPFPSNSVDTIFHEHVMEHMAPHQGYMLMKECYRLLKPGGVLRIVMPDANKYIRSYIDPENEFINSWRPGRFTPMIALQEEFYGFGHRAIYDSTTVQLFCRTAGFSLVESKMFGESRIVPCPDSEWRISDSFYTEAVK